MDPFVTVRRQAVLYDGTNAAQVQAVVIDPAFSVADTGTDALRWVCADYQVDLQVGEYLLYDQKPSEYSYQSLEAVSADRYARQFVELPAATVITE